MSEAERITHRWNTRRGGLVLAGALTLAVARR